MKRIIILFVFILTVSFSKVVVGQPIEVFKLLDQFGKEQTILSSTKKLIFVFKKDTGHLLKGYFAVMPKDYLESKSSLFIADITTMPSIIKYFVLPFTGYDYSIVVLDNEILSDCYKNKLEEEKIMVVTLDNLIVTGVKYVSTIDEVEEELK